MQPRLFALVMNSRDIGRYNSIYGTAKRGIIFRSGSLSEIDEETKLEMLNKGITTIIDLRSLKAKKREPDPTSSDPRFHYLSLRLESGERLPNSRSDALRIYEEMYTSKKEVKDILLAVSSSEKGVLIHCSAGKDRTGVIISLLQYIAGVSLNDINKEYLLSYDDIKPHINHLQELGTTLSPAYYSKDESFLPELYSILKRRFGNEEAYFTYMGLDNDLLEAIKRKELA